ncbi:MAG: putative toxin-antitoxin system toxin component, PIN family [Bacteroidetes bacterium]|nr:putative toxin-antitoxin system toxin component, PIN family [Fibrella sp.]
MRIVIDTNLYISALINEHSRQKLDVLLLNPTLAILLDDALLAELNDVIHRPKFRRFKSNSSHACCSNGSPALKLLLLHKPVQAQKTTFCSPCVAMAGRTFC